MKITKRIVGANRDENLTRKTKRACFWHNISGMPNILSGIDLQEKKPGSWIGINKEGKFAFVTNFREPQQLVNGKSRGRLVTDYLSGNLDLKQYVDILMSEALLYNGFNLVVGDIKDTTECYFVTNRINEHKRFPFSIKLESDIVYGISNGEFSFVTSVISGVK